MGDRPLRGDDRGIAAAKQAARARARQARAALPSAERARATSRIVAHLEELRAAEGAQRMGVYAATGDEVDLDELITAWLAADLVVALPRALDDGLLAFHRVTSIPTARQGPFGIREPAPTDPPVEDLDLVVTPGLAFDAQGGRLGYGRGYYDRYLGAENPSHMRPMSVGVCFAGQLVAAVPQDVHDVSLDAVVTEDGVYR